MKKVVVTGGGGFIGKALVRRLRQGRLDVTVIGRNHYPDLAEEGVSCRRGDIGDKLFLVEAFAGADTVFHVAAKAGIWGPYKEYYQTNVAGTRNVIDACRENSVGALVYTSTPSVVFDQHDLEGADESLPYATRPLCHYAATKIDAEKMVLAANSSTTATAAIRPHLVWGPGDNHLIPRLLERGREKGLKIVGDGSNRVDITYIDNVVLAHILAAENLHDQRTAAGEAFFIGQNQPVVLWQWINELFSTLGIEKVNRSVPFPIAYVAGMALEIGYKILRLDREPKMTRFVAHQLADSHWFDHGKAERILGYSEEVSTDEGLRRLISWLNR